MLLLAMLAVEAPMRSVTLMSLGLAAVTDVLLAGIVHTIARELMLDNPSDSED